MSLDDPQLRFYLKHKVQIDEWAALRPREVDAAKTLMRAWAADLRNASYGGDVRIVDKKNGRRVYVGLRHLSWDRDGGPATTVALSWYRKTVSLGEGDGDADRGSRCPWVGVRVDGLVGRKSPHGALRALLAQSPELLEIFPIPDTPDSNWAVYRDIYFDGAPSTEEVELQRAKVLQDLASAVPIVTEILDRYRSGLVDPDAIDD